jgi:hypothetical protein
MEMLKPFRKERRNDEAYQQTYANWEYFLERLKSYLETGKGTPGFPLFL